MCWEQLEQEGHLEDLEDEVPFQEEEVDLEVLLQEVVEEGDLPCQAVEEEAVDLPFLEEEVAVEGLPYLVVEEEGVVLLLLEVVEAAVVLLHHLLSPRTWLEEQWLP